MLSFVSKIASQTLSLAHSCVYIDEKFSQSTFSIPPIYSLFSTHIHTYTRRYMLVLRSLWTIDFHYSFSFSLVGYIAVEDRPRGDEIFEREGERTRKRVTRADG